MGRGPVDYQRKAMKGSFLAAIVLLEMKQIDVDEVIELSEGLRLIHYACFYGKIEVIKVLCEEYGVDILAKDYRG